MHYELALPLVLRSAETAMCHIHCETDPYVTGARLTDVGAAAAPFLRFKDAFRTHLHTQIAMAARWGPRKGLWEAGVSKIDLREEMTIGELAEDLGRALDEGRSIVAESVQVASRAV